MSVHDQFQRAASVLIIVCLTIAVFVGCDSGAWPTVAETAQKSVAAVETDKGWGSAVAFKVRGSDRIFFLTAKHVVEKTRIMSIRVESHARGFKAGYFTVPAKLVFLSPGTDAAILTIPPVQWDFLSARIERGLPHVGNEVYAVGNMHGANFDRTVSQGIVSQLGVIPKDYTNFPWDLVDQTTAINLPGSSGGPVFDRYSGKLLGIQVGNLESAIFLYLPSRVLLAYAHTEGWGWLFGDGKFTEARLTELISKVPALAPEPPPSFLQQLLSIPGIQVVPGSPAPAAPAPGKGLAPDLKKGHR